MVRYLSSREVGTPGTSDPAPRVLTWCHGEGNVSPKTGEGEVVSRGIEIN